MKLLHLADLHLGKTLHSLSLIESGDQPHWIRQILAYIAQEKPDAVAIAGDVYDRGVPAREAIPLLSDLLTGIARMDIPVFLIAGNHDGGERMEFAAELLQEKNVYISGSVHRELMHVTRDFGDGFGPVTFWLMPYVYPAVIRQALGLDEESVLSYTDAVRLLLDAQDIDMRQRNVLIAHQTVLQGGKEPEHGKSETAIGGIGGIDTDVFKGFDYVALGHIHASQRVGCDYIRYAGSPLCYHFSEAGQEKGPLMVTLGRKGDPVVCSMAGLEPLHRVRETMRGSLQDIIAAEKASTAREEYVRTELTDEWIPPDTHNTLAALFRGHDCLLLDIARDPDSKRQTANSDGSTNPDEMSLEDYFLAFYRKQTGKDDPEPSEMALIRFAAGQVNAGSEKSSDEMARELAQYALLQEVKA